MEYFIILSKKLNYNNRLWNFTQPAYLEFRYRILRQQTYAAIFIINIQMYLQTFHTVKKHKTALFDMAAPWVILIPGSAAYFGCAVNDISLNRRDLKNLFFPFPVEIPIFSYKSESKMVKTSESGYDYCVFYLLFFCNFADALQDIISIIKIY